MWKFLETSPARAVIWVAAGIVLSLVLFYALRRFRDQAREEDTTVDHLANFREMESRGVLAEKEFRTIKTTLSEKLKGEIQQENGNTERP